ncbi:hypothetical protein BDN72DRAFT_851616 [Pluteus cervinus]|uniref:Uncharacterized protein n=1 Tax=Pluteus cervinus TaxID=181527 RepID=A0ACD2ZZJ5_9AGAR|nr:hypothetical protein BDN72DRAFT_851616 [Pluteus cervinus]
MRQVRVLFRRLKGRPPSWSLALSSLPLIAHRLLTTYPPNITWAQDAYMWSGSSSAQANIGMTSLYQNHTVDDLLTHQG